jgi:hypothetical protein
METMELEPYTLCVLDESGDTRMQWDKDKPEEIAKAQARFEELKKQGYLAYAVTKKGDRGTVIDKFDPNAERIICHKQMIGG